MSENGRRRQPRNLQDVLRLAAENSDPTAENVAQPLAPERREWLNSVLSSMGSDHITVMKANIQILMENIDKRGKDEETEEDISKQENALENLIEVVDNLDFANDFQKIGGFNIIFPILKLNSSCHSGLRWRVANLCAELFQNNPYCQNAALTESNGELLGLLMELLDNDLDSQVKIKCIHAISCLVRNNSEAFTCFQRADGFSYLIKALQKDIEKLSIKTCFMLTSCCEDHPEIKENLFKMGYVELLINLLHTDHNLVDEYILNILISFINDYQPSIDECTRPELNLKQILQAKIKNLGDAEEYMEQVEYSKLILEKCFPAVDNDNTER